MSRADRPARGLFGASLGFWLVCGSFVAVSTMLLPDLRHVIDEGANILYGRRVAAGQVPHVDFFYHQPPLHLLLLSLVANIEPHSIFLYRLPSLLATAASGWVVYRIALQLGTPLAALMAAGLFYFTPLQTYGMKALPEAPMLLLSLVGAYVVVFRRGRGFTVLGALCLVAAVMFKPLALASIAAVGVALLADRERRADFVLFAGTVAVGGLGCSAALHVVTDGMFSELLSVSFDRFTRKTWFDRFLALTGLTEMVPEFFTRSPLHFALFSHLLALVYMSLALVPAAIGGLRFLRPSGGLDLAARVLLIGWLAFPLFFSLAVWEPAWTHYHVQYLPTLALLGGLCLARLFGRSATARVLTGGWLAAALVLTLLFETTMRTDYSGLRALELEGEVLAFDPYLNVLTRTEPACGLADPMNQTPPTVFEGVAVFQRYRITTEMLIDCMERSPEIPILLDAEHSDAFMVIDEQMYRYILRQPRDRVVTLGESDRAALAALFGDASAL